MKTLIVCFVSFTSYNAFADIDLARLAGTYESKCTQSQISTKIGNAIETYTFGKDGAFQFARKWFKDAGCKEKSYEDDAQNGKFKVGKENTNNGFNPENTYEVEYKTKNPDHGLLWADKNYSKVRIARGMGKVQNTMLGMFEFTKK